MFSRVSSPVNWLLGQKPNDAPGHLLPRWLFLRGLGLIYFSVFYSLAFQIRGLIGPEGILPAGAYLKAVAEQLGAKGYWFAPTLLWLGGGPRALELLWGVGILASLLLTLNIWPRGMLVVCFAAFLSFIAAAQDFSSYQSDGMLLGASFLGWFFAPPGWRPGLGAARPPSRATLFLLQWLWFRIYFESGVAKLAGGDPEWRHLTAMDQYYQNGPLPTWIGWYAQQLPHWFHAATVLGILVLELVLVWMVFLPRRFRIICFWVVTPWQIGIILTANYAFLNHLVLLLGVLLLDDRHLARLRGGLRWRWASSEGESADQKGEPEATRRVPAWLVAWRPRLAVLGMWISGFFLAWIFYATTALLLWMIFPRLPLPVAPVQILDPFRIANQYGLFGVMTRGRYEIEFQGSRDGHTWVPYPFRYKPQGPREPPRIYAPYQPRFDWNLWFASLGSWREYPFVLRTERLLLDNDADVLSLFAGNPFSSEPPREVRAVIWQYWFTTPAEKRAQGVWWRRELLGLYAPTLRREPDGTIGVAEWPRAPALSPRP